MKIRVVWKDSNPRVKKNVSKVDIKQKEKVTKDNNEKMIFPVLY